MKTTPDWAILLALLLRFSGWATSVAFAGLIIAAASCLPKADVDWGEWCYRLTGFTWLLVDAFACVVFGVWFSCRNIEDLARDLVVAVYRAGRKDLPE